MLLDANVCSVACSLQTFSTFACNYTCHQEGMRGGMNKQLNALQIFMQCEANEQCASAHSICRDSPGKHKGSSR